MILPSLMTKKPHYKSYTNSRETKNIDKINQTKTQLASKQAKIAKCRTSQLKETKMDKVKKMVCKEITLRIIYQIPPKTTNKTYTNTSGAMILGLQWASPTVMQQYPIHRLREISFCRLIILELSTVRFLLDTQVIQNLQIDIEKEF